LLEDELDYFLSYVLNLDPSVRAPIISAAATCLAALLGFGGVIFTIGRQGRNAINANTANEQLKRKIEIYEQVLGTTRRADEISVALTGFLNNFTLTLDLIRVSEDLGRQWQPPTARYPQYSELLSEAYAAFTGVITLIESWHIIEPKLDVFRYAISMGMRELTTVVRPIPDPLIYAMPAPRHEEKWEFPDPQRLEVIKRRVEMEVNAISRLSCWVGDFKIEMQILLLSDLFRKPVERREPEDPDFFCIRLDRYGEIMRTIGQTDWMAEKTRFEAEARARFLEKNRAKP
jgi:hypothetical protein